MLFLKSDMARLKEFTSSGLRFNVYSTNRKAVFRPIPGSLANSFTAFSNKAEGYFCIIKIVQFWAKIAFLPIFRKFRDKKFK
jgi:hypothetical protein